MRRITLLSAPCLSLLICGLLSTGCAAHGSTATEEPASQAASSSEDDERKVMMLEQAQTLAHARLKVAEMKAASSEANDGVRLAKAQADVGLAEQELAKFIGTDMPTSIASAKLDLRSMQDRVQESADELAQIELMYADQDLNDKTAEFVVSRGRRSADRAMARLEIQQVRFATLTEAELPMQQRRLELALESKQAALAETERDIAIGQHNQEIALMEARNKAEAAGHDLNEAREDKQ
ncbi:MAG: hypothetical protein ACI9K5_001590 [Gammaproteobacteria bacterium]|jgi:hypothetical protein